MIHNDAYEQEHTMSPANFGRRDSRLVLSQEMEREGQGSRAEAAPDLVLRNGLTARQIPAAPASHHGMGAVPPGRRSGNVQPTTSYCTFGLRGQRFSILSNATHEAKSCESRRKPSLLSRTRPMWGVLAWYYSTYSKKPRMGSSGAQIPAKRSAAPAILYSVAEFLCSTAQYYTFEAL